MPTPEIHEMKHKAIDKEIEGLKCDTKEIDNRVVALEKSDLLINEQLRNQIKSLDTLVQWIKWALGIGIVSYVSFFAWLLQQRLK